MVADLLRARMVARGLNQYQLAKASKVPQGHLSKLLDGTYKFPRRATRDRIGGVLGISESEWFRAGGMLPADELAGDAGIAPDDPLGDVLRWLRQDPEVVAGFLAARRDLGPEVYPRYVRVLAAMWKANQIGQYKTWRLAQGLPPEEPDAADPGDAGDAA